MLGSETEKREEGREMTMRVLGLGVAILLLSAASATAQSEYGGEVGAYVGGSVFYALDTSKAEFGELADEHSVGVDVRVGLRLGKPIGMELQGDWNHGLRDLDLWTITTNFRVYYSEFEAIADLFPDPLQLYIVGGVGVMGGDPRTKGDPYQVTGAFRMGLGVDYYVTENIAVDVGSEWVVGTSFFSDVSYLKVGVGIQYNF